jgi:hypothetical protein
MTTRLCQIVVSVTDQRPDGMPHYVSLDSSSSAPNATAFRSSLHTLTLHGYRALPSGQYDLLTCHASAPACTIARVVVWHNQFIHTCMWNAQHRSGYIRFILSYLLVSNVA